MIQMIGNPDTAPYEWMNALYGAPMDSAYPAAMRLVHELAREASLLQQWHLETPDGIHWRVHLLQPIAPPSHAGQADRVLLSGDGCWPHCVSPEAMHACLAQGITLAWFDRLELADDPPSGARQGAFYTRYPDSMSGCLMVWAWAIATTAHALKVLLPKVKVGVIGHSRGGKAALLAAAIDDGIDAVVANNSGTGGAASLAVASEGAESSAELIARYPHWFSETANNPAVQQRLLELDCASLWAKIAPRPVLILQAQGDAWANPAGTRQTFAALQPHWSAAPTNTLALIERDGDHPMQADDWTVAACWWRNVLVV